MNVQLANYPEVQFGGFSRENCSVEFYTRINALVQQHFRILDFGAGRGGQIGTDKSAYSRSLKIFKGRVAHVEGCDIDPDVLENPYLDGAQVFAAGGRLPYEDGSFDLIYSNWVLEHVEDPVSMVAEIVRVLKPGGFFCAMTPNRHGYIATAARIAGNRRHVPLLKKIQPDRKDFDIFPTVYAMNTRRKVKELLSPFGEIVAYTMNSEPAYHFNKNWLLKVLKFVQKITPDGFQTVLFVFFRKAS